MSGVDVDHQPSHLDEARIERTKKVAEAALERYGLLSTQIYLLQDKGIRQVVRVVSPSRGEFVLRMYKPVRARARGGSSDARVRPSQRRSQDTLRAQLLWLSAIRHDTGLLVPQPVPTVDGSLVSYVDVGYEDKPWRPRLLRRVLRRRRDRGTGDDLGQYCVLLEWMQGGHKRNDLNPADLSLVGSLVARLHQHAERYTVPEDTAFPRWDWHWPFGESAPLWSKGEAFYSADEMEVLKATAERAREDLRALGESRNVFGLIHGDINLGNLIFCGGTVGIIDFDTCGWGYYLYDLSRLYTALRRHYRNRAEPLLAALLKGYERERPLPNKYERYFETFAAMRMVAKVNIELDLLRPKKPPRRPVDLRYLSETVKHCELLI